MKIPAGKSRYFDFTLQETKEMRVVCFYPEKREDLKQKEESHFTMNNSYELSLSGGSRWLDIGRPSFFFACLWTETESSSKNDEKRKLSQ